MKALQYNIPLKAGNPLKLGIFSDIHFDSPHSDHQSLKKHLDFCLKDNRFIIINGDLYDGILLKDGKRATNHLMEKEDNQINTKINKVVEFLKPYKDHILFIGRGNHEESILKYSGIDILELTVQLLNAGSKYQIQYGNYTNLLRFSFTNIKNKSVLHYDMFLHHGLGGNSPVTAGMIDFNRLSTSVLADLIVIGHKHRAIQNNSQPVMYADQYGEIKIKNRQFIQTPSYQKHHDDDNHNILFNEKFYTLNALPGFASVELTPYVEDGKYQLGADVKLVTNPVAKAGELAIQKLKLNQKAR